MRNQSHQGFHCTLPYFAPICVAMCACESAGNAGNAPKQSGGVDAVRRMECLRICGQYRSNCAPNTKRAVGTRVRPSRQSQCGCVRCCSTALWCVVCRIECLRICGQYRPNCAPNTERAVGSCVRPSRQSQDCLRGRPLRAPALSVMVRSALGSVLPTVARGALSLQLKRSADVALRLCRKMRHSLANARHLV